MRVKKLCANRRPKAGDDDDSSVVSSPSSPPPTWVSPTKPDHEPHQRIEINSDIGSSSPTDPSGVHHPLFPDDVLSMANSQPPPHHPHVHPSTVAPRESAPPAHKPLSLALAKKTRNNSSSWREYVPHTVREGVHAKIVAHLKALKPNAPDAVLARLPGLASRMETTLLQLASTQDEYVDAKTLAARLGAVQQSNAKKLLQQQTTPTAAAPADVALRSRTPLSEDQARFVFQCLQNWRQKLVTIYGVAPWEILPNAVLATVAVYAPSTEQELAICGVRDERIARFGSALLQELQLICGSTATARPVAGGAVKAARKADASKRQPEPKKRKTTVLAPAERPTAFLMPPPPPQAASASTGSSVLSPRMPLFRANGGMDALPSLLPSGSGLKPSPLFASPLPRTPSSTQATTAGSSSSDALHSSMHLLAQGAGHVSQQQQDAKTIDAYEKELQSTRWLLQQAQQENERLREQVQQLLHRQ